METQDLNALFRASMRARREAAGWSQADLARRLDDAGLGALGHQTTVARIESGARPVKLDEAAAIARALDARVEEMIAAPETDAARASELLREYGRLIGEGLLRRAQLQVIVKHLRALPDDVVERLDGQERALLDMARGASEEEADANISAALKVIVERAAAGQDDAVLRPLWAGSVAESER